MKKLGLYFIVCVFFLTNFSCASHKQPLLIAKEDREIVDGFLRFVAISQFGVYTIMGSKPMTGIYFPEVYTDEERRTLYDAQSKGYRKAISFKKFCNNIEVRRTCSEWLKIQDKYVGEHFIIRFDSEMSLGYLVNVPLVIYLLRDQYQDFAEFLGADFDPDVVSREIGDDSSASWQVIKHNSYLLGLLYGFGERNAKLFQWEMDKKISLPFRTASDLLPSMRRNLSRQEDKIKKLIIPQFIVYQPIDEVVERYVLERKRIQQIYKGKDFAETTVAFLKGEAPDQLRPTSYPSLKKE